MSDQEAAALAANLAELDSRLVAVIGDALREKALVHRNFIMAGDPAVITEHIARAVWAWLAEGDE